MIICFFECPYSSEVVQSVFGQAGCSSFPVSWDDVVAFIVDFKGSALVWDFIKLLFTTSVYRICNARNKKLHEDSLIPASWLIIDIISIVKARLTSSKKFRAKAIHSLVLRRWL